MFQEKLKKSKSLLTIAYNKWYYTIVVSERDKESFKNFQKVLTLIIKLDIITNVVSGNGGIGRRAGLRIL